MIFKKLIKYILFNFSAIFKFFFINTREEFHSNKFVLSHNLGGGTLFYEKQQNYDDYIIVRKLGMGKDLIFELSFNNKKKYVLKSNLIKKLNLSYEIIISSLVTYKPLFFWLSYFKSLKTEKKVKIIYLVHDYHCVCENNNFLLNDNFFCNLSCRNCKLNEENIITLYQKKWGNFLCLCDKVKCFSRSSQSILEEIYRDKMLKFEILPHNTEYCDEIKPLEFNYDFLNIAIVGNCNNIAKGKLFAKSFAEYCKKIRQNLFFLGKVNKFNQIKSKNIFYLGKYNIKDLSELISYNKINCVLFSSVCPETFSYVISELKALNIPIAALKIGAQYEKLMGYEKFIPLENTDSEYVYKTIKRCLIEEK